MTSNLAISCLEWEIIEKKSISSITDWPVYLPAKAVYLLSQKLLMLFEVICRLLPYASLQADNLANPMTFSL